MTNQPTRSTGTGAARVAAFAATLAAALAVFPNPARAQAPAPAAAPSTTTATTTVKATTTAGKFGVATLGPAGLPADLRIKLEDAAAAGLRASGAEVVSATELSRARAAAALGACADSVCEQRLAQITDTRYWVRGTCTIDASTYRFHLELTDARTGATLSARDDTCDICTEAEAAEAMNIAASALKVKANLPRPQLAAPAPAVAPAAALPITGNDAPAPESSGTADEGTNAKPMWQKVLPWVAFAGAAAALATGAYFWSTDGDCAKFDGATCERFKVRSPEKYILLGAGAALAATGVVLLVIPAPSSDAPATVALSGRF